MNQPSKPAIWDSIVMIARTTITNTPNTIRWRFFFFFFFSRVCQAPTSFAHADSVFAFSFVKKDVKWEKIFVRINFNWSISTDTKHRSEWAKQMQEKKKFLIRLSTA